MATQTVKGLRRRNQALVALMAVMAIHLVPVAGAASAAEKPVGGTTGKTVEVSGWRDVPDLVPRLRNGGLVLYIRHAATDVKQADQRPIDLNDCAKQRNLSAKGRDQSKAIGAAFRALGAPVGDVLSSPFCRTLETARLAFGRAEKNDALYFAIGISPEEKAKAREALRRMLSDPPPKGTNRIVVSHTANLKDATGIWPKPEGVAIVFAPQSDGKFRAFARIEPDDWEAIAKNAPPPK